MHVELRNCHNKQVNRSFNGAENQAAARVNEGRDTYWVHCTPSGGAKSVRIELPGEWETSYSDEDLLGKIEAKR
ncbi:hypothetical protein NUACC21_40410 [Scytonema sp. NUACC21]